MDKKELIRKAAIKVMAKEGYHDSKMEAIAEKAGIAVGSIYNYFKNKQEVLEYIFYVIYEEKINYIKQLEKKEGASIEKISLFMKFQHKQWEDNPDVIKILIQDAVPFCKYAPHTKKMYDVMVERLINIIKVGQNSGEIKEIDPCMVAILIFKSPKIIRYNLKSINSKEYRTRKEQMAAVILEGIKR